MRQFLPPGITLYEGERLSAAELIAEWIAYTYEMHFDRLLQATMVGCMYDMMWTPCLMFLPIQYSLSWFVAGTAIDCIWAICILAGFKVWGIRWQSGELCTLLTDLATCMPWELIGLGMADGQPLLWLRFVFKLRRFQRVRSLVTRRYREDVRANWNQVSIRLWLVYILIFTHWSGLTWAFLGTDESGAPREDGWIYQYTASRRVTVGGKRLNASELVADVPSLYLRSVYWATITMTTVGYGDITPGQRLAEQGCAMIVIVAGLVLYLLLSAEFTTLISNSSRLGEEFQTIVEQTRRYLTYRHVPSGLRKRVRAYFALRWKRTRGFSEAAVINELPRSLALDVRVELYKDLLDRVPLFKGVEDTFVRQLVKLVTLDFYMPDEYIIRKDDVGKEMFFIQRGICHVLADDELTPLFTLPTGSFFGEIALVLSERRSASVAAGTACDILVLHRRELFLTLNDYPDVAQLLHDFARRRLNERRIAEEEKEKADALRDKMAEIRMMSGGGEKTCRSSSISHKQSRSSSITVPSLGSLPFPRRNTNSSCSGGQCSGAAPGSLANLNSTSSNGPRPSRISCNFSAPLSAVQQTARSVSNAFANVPSRRSVREEISSQPAPRADAAQPRSRKSQIFSKRTANSIHPQDNGRREDSAENQPAAAASSFESRFCSQSGDRASCVPVLNPLQEQGSMRASSSGSQREPSEIRAGEDQVTSLERPGSSQHLDGDALLNVPGIGSPGVPISGRGARIGSLFGAKADEVAEASGSRRRNFTSRRIDSAGAVNSSTPSTSRARVGDGLAAATANVPSIELCAPADSTGSGQVQSLSPNANWTDSHAGGRETELSLEDEEQIPKRNNDTRFSRKGSGPKTFKRSADRMSHRRLPDAHGHSHAVPRCDTLTTEQQVQKAIAATSALAGDPGLSLEALMVGNACNACSSSSIFTPDGKMATRAADAQGALNVDDQHRSDSPTLFFSNNNAELRHNGGLVVGGRRSRRNSCNSQLSIQSNDSSEGMNDAHRWLQKSLQDESSTPNVVVLCGTNAESGGPSIPDPDPSHHWPQDASQSEHQLVIVRCTADNSARVITRTTACSARTASDSTGPLAAQLSLLAKEVDAKQQHRGQEQQQQEQSGDAVQQTFPEHAETPEPPPSPPAGGATGGGVHHDAVTPCSTAEDGSLLAWDPPAQGQSAEAGASHTQPTGRKMSGSSGGDAQGSCGENSCSRRGSAADEAPRGTFRSRRNRAGSVVDHVQPAVKSLSVASISGVTHTGVSPTTVKQPAWKPRASRDNDSSFQQHTLPALPANRPTQPENRVSDAEKSSLDRDGMDAATFINTRPWVRVSLDSSETHNVDDGKQMHYWDPDRVPARAVDTAGAALNYINMFLLPIICFMHRELNLSWMLSMLGFDVWMIWDMVMHLRGRRPYYDRIELVVEKRLVRRHYLRTRFAVDLISSIPYELFALVGTTSFVRLTTSPLWRFGRLRVALRFYRVHMVLQRLEDTFELQNYIALTRLVLLLLLLVHWLSCFWLFLGLEDNGWARLHQLHVLRGAVELTETTNMTNPLVEECLNDPYEGCSRLYVKSLYWVVATLITVGYGDVHPNTNEEVIFAAIVCFCFHAMFSYMLGLITSYVFSLNRTAALFRDKLAQLAAFMEYRQLSPSVRSRISELYSGRLWRSTGGLDEQAILSALPASIRRNLSLLMYAELLLNVPLFTDAEFGFIQSLADRLRPHVYPPNEFVVLIGEIGREMFFCARGECEVLGKDNVRVFTITDGMFFGEVAVLFSMKCTATVRTVTYCDLLSLSKEGLGDAMRDYPKAANIISLRAKERMKQLGIQTAALREVVGPPTSGTSERVPARASA